MKRYHSIPLLVLIVFFTISNFAYLYSDDFYYATFFKSGIGGFIAAHKDHYTTVNGRVFVHVINTLVLHFKEALFPFVNTALFFLFAYLSVNQPKAKKEVLMWRIAIVMMLILLMPVNILVESLFWTSGVMNYLLPAVVIMLFYRLLDNVLTPLPIVLFLAFLSGATTEQSGFLAMLVIFFTFIKYVVHKNKKLVWRSTASMVMAGIGYSTLFFSPGIMNRISNSSNILFSDQLTDLINNMVVVSTRIVAPSGLFFVIVLCLVTVSLTFLYKNKQKIQGSIGFVIVISMFLNVFSSLFTLVIAGLYLLYWGVVSLRKKANEDAAVLIMSGVLVQGVTLLLAPMGGRILLVTGLFLVAGTVLLIPQTPSFLKNSAYIVLIPFIVASLPLAKGYYYNHLNFRENIESIEKRAEANTIEWNMDIDSTYAHKMFYENAYFQNSFLKMYNLPENTVIYYTSTINKAIYVNDTRLTLPMLVHHENMYPIGELLLSLGEEIIWDAESRSVRFILGDQVFFIDAMGYLRRENYAKVDNLKFEKHFSSYYVGESFFSDYYDFELLENKVLVKLKP